MSSLIRNPRMEERVFFLPDPDEEARRNATPIIQGYSEAELLAARAEARRAGQAEAWLEIAPRKAELEAETHRAVTSFLDLARGLESELRALLLEHAEELSRFAFEIARVIVRHEIEQSPATIVPLVRELLERAAAAERVHVRLSLRDYGYLKQDPSLLPETLAFANLRLRPDSSLSPGGCVIESEQGNWDGRLETQLTRLGEALRAATLSAKDGDSGDRKQSVGDRTDRVDAHGGRDRDDSDGADEVLEAAA